MKTFLHIFITLLSLSASVQAAAISLSGRIQGRLNADFLNSNLYTLHFYWFTVTEPTTITYTWCVTNGPGGHWNTSIDSHVRPNADEFADLDLIIGGGTGGAFCSSASIFMEPGRYLFDVVARGGGYDGLDGLRPLDYSDKPFVHFDYNATVQGDHIRLDEIWMGQANNTYTKIFVPEPGAGVLGILVAGLMLWKRRRRSAAPIVLAAVFFAAPPARAEEGVIRWQSQEGMGYRLQCSVDNCPHQ